MRRFLRQARLELRSLLEHYLLPGFVVIWPYHMGFWLIRWLAKYPGLYEEEWRPAWAQAKQYVHDCDEAQFAYRYRLTRLVDHADYWWSRTRSYAFLRKYVDNHQAFAQQPEAFVGCFFHWCAGLWAVRALKVSGRDSAVLAGRFSPRSMGGSYLAYVYGKLRLKELARNSGLPLIYAPGTIKQAEQVMQEGGSVIGTPDVPPTETRYGKAVGLFGQPAMFAEGLLMIAKRGSLPVVVFTLALDEQTGRRSLRTWPMFDPNDPQALQKIVDVWQGLLQEKPWGFTLWSMMPSFFTNTDV